MSFFESQTAQDPIYAALRQPENDRTRDARLVVELLWQIAAPYVDHDIQRKAAVRFHPHFWELYLAACLLRAEVPLLPRSAWAVRGRGPDLQMAEPKVWIEAVASTAGTGPDAVTDVPPGVVRDVPDDAIKLRILGAISEKVTKFEQYVQDGTIEPSARCVIAVNTGLAARMWCDQTVPRVVRCLFPFGNEVIDISLGDGRVVGRRHEHQPVVTKLSGATVPTTGFETPGWSRISAVIHSGVDVFNGTSAMGQEFAIVHNPQAINPVPRGLFKLGTEYWAEEQSMRIRRW